MTAPRQEPSRPGRFRRPDYETISDEQPTQPERRKWSTILRRGPAAPEHGPGPEPAAPGPGSWPGPEPQPEPEPPIRFLIVCTANRCRSPMAATLLRDRLRAVDAPTLVSSAGTLAEDGLPAMRYALVAVNGTSGHSSRPVTADLLEEADLVLCMTREHVRTIVMLSPDVFGRTFTLEEFVRRAAAAGPRRSGEALESWLAWIGTGRRTSDLVGYHDPDDIDDPIGLPAEAYRRCAAEIDALLATAVSLVFPEG